MGLQGAMFDRGARYAAVLGQAEALREETRALLEGLERALEFPVELTLHSRPTEGVGWLRGGWTRLQGSEGVNLSVVRVATSGTTGPPKFQEHDLAAAFAKKRPGVQRENWLLTYAPYRWAGLSVMLHCLRSGCILSVPAQLDPWQIVEEGVRSRVTHVGLTPSLFRKLLIMAGPIRLSEMPLQQVTFGGEAAGEQTLDTARRVWPLARVTQVYASTELGDVLSVSDGLAGVPARKLERPGFAFSPEGELVVGAYATGDIWRKEGERYYFLGRVQEVINVGGHKVSPLEVEEAALRLPGVSEARAYGAPSPLLGQLVALEYRGEAEEVEVRRGLAGSLAKVARPAVVRRVEEIMLTAAMKTGRVGG